MKKILCFLLVLMLLCTPILFVGCGEEVEEVEIHTVKIICNSNVTKVVKVEDGRVIGDFTKELGMADMFVSRWSYYTDITYTKEWDLFRDKVYSDMTLYGKAIPIV